MQLYIDLNFEPCPALAGDQTDCECGTQPDIHNNNDTGDLTFHLCRCGNITWTIAIMCSYNTSNAFLLRC